MTRGGAVTLYHNNSARLATSSTGVSITGTLTVSSNTLVTNLNADLLDGLSPSTSGTSNIVSRDASGNFSAGTITATDFDSTSDVNFKKDIIRIENSLETVEKLNGVKFTWKSNDKKSIGVIAQEVEKVLPELVSQNETKSVNYNGIVGVLIEAVKELSAEVKELSAEVQELKSQLNN
jgi:hypothetical protein